MNAIFVSRKITSNCLSVNSASVNIDFMHNIKL